MNKIIQEDLEYITSSTIVDWKQFKNSTVLITGASGMLASYMVRTLLYLNENILKDNQCKVIALVRNENKARENFKDYENDNNLSFIIQDVCKSIYVDKQKINYVIHASSIASPKYYNEFPVDVILPNTLGTLNTLNLSIKHKVESYLFFSAGEIYNENNPLDIRSCYGESKRLGENLCVCSHHQYNVPIKIVRPFHTYGPGMDLEGGRVFEDFVNNIVHNKNIELKSDGSARRQFCYIADATIAFFKVLLDGKNGQAYDIANIDQTVSIKDLARMLLYTFPEKHLQFSYIKHDKDYLPSSTKEYIPNITNINNLGWNPVFTIREGFKRTIKSFYKGEC